MSEAIQEALRDMAGQIGTLSATVSNLERNWRSQDEKASSGRAVLYEKIDSLRDEFHSYRGRLDKVIEEVAVMRPTIDEIKVARERAIGVFWVSRIFYAVGLVLTAGVTWVASNWIKITIR